jgi:hypothetical protein
MSGGTVTWAEAVSNALLLSDSDGLTEYLSSLPGRCPECGYHAPTQGHLFGVRHWWGFEPWEEAGQEVEGCSRWAPQCAVCGEYREGAGLTVKCRDWHETCLCGARYDEPKGPGCRRRKHVKPERVELAA